jgi:hypothetical protein
MNQQQTIIIQLGQDCIKTIKLGNLTKDQIQQMALDWISSAVEAYYEPKPVNRVFHDAAQKIRYEFIDILHNH